MKGQIVEIPARAALYKIAELSPASKKEQLECQLHYQHYSLFDGFLVGEHLGTHHFKLGQRKGINVGGKKAPLYVIGMDESENRIFVGEGEDHPGLFTQVLSFSADQTEWVQQPEFSAKMLEQGIPVEISIAGFQNREALLYLINNTTYLEFEHPISVSLATAEMALFHHTTIIANLKTTL